MNLHLTPVDYVSDAVVAIAFQSGSDGRAYNIINQNLMPMNQVGRLMRRAGYRVETLPYDEWCVRLGRCPAEENVLRILSASSPTGAPKGEPRRPVREAPAALPDGQRRPDAAGDRRLLPAGRRRPAQKLPELFPPVRIHRRARGARASGLEALTAAGLSSSSRDE